MAAEIAYYEGLDDDEYEAALVGFAREQDPIDAAAIRSDALAFRSRKAVQSLLRQLSTKRLPNAPGDQSRRVSLREARAVHGRLEHEARLLDAVTAGIAARRGELITPANPRRRALEALRAEHPERYLDLLRAEEEKARQRAAERRAATKRARRAQRDAERTAQES
ncbi:hypothetical protein [Peterkaempfera bronchialis]|uniref:hypothetical protein n=1 Tax=Peterkaempfera bronchialis TaxID=2126346 RepID=UPI0013B45D2C|nr:hypothetical protein [Peterkaempfera bronchialis]